MNLMSENHMRLMLWLAWRSSATRYVWLHGALRLSSCILLRPSNVKGVDNGFKKKGTLLALQRPPHSARMVPAP